MSCGNEERATGERRGPMPRITIDGKSVSVPEGSTVLEAARAVGAEIPTLCHHEGLPPQTSCMVCVVRIEGQPRLAPSCATMVREGMVVETCSEEIAAARRMALELLLSDHLGDCIAPCQLACPAGMDIPLMTRQIVAGDLAGAVATVRERIPLPSVLGRICPAPCESACRRAAHDEAVAICLLKRWVGDEHLAAEDCWRPDPKAPSGRRVAIVGAGPAGLSAACYLRLEGHDVTLFEERERAGGGMLEAEDLPAWALEAEVEAILREGIELRGGIRIGREMQLSELTARFDATLLAPGEVDEAAADELGVEHHGRGLAADRSTHESSLAGVFVAGSARSPSKLAVRAVGDGREAALEIDRYLRGEAIAPAARPFNVPLGRIDETEAARMAEAASDRPRTTPSRGDYLGFNDEEAVREALRCMHCDCRALHSCRLRAVAAEHGADTRAFPAERRRFSRDATHPAIIFEPGKCIACGLCVEIARGYEEELGLTFVGRGFNVRTTVPFGASLEEGLQRAAEECARICPTGAIVLRGDGGEEVGEDGA